MDRRHLEYFVAVAELGSFTRAAQSLSIAQPSLSHAIGWLERDLGARLFERHGRGVRLTPAGEALLEPARRSLRSFQIARGAVRAVSEAGFGRLSVITNTLWAVDPLARLVGGFRMLHPGVQISVGDPVHRGDVLDAIRLGRAELGLLDGTPPAEVVAGRWVADHEFVAMLPPGPELDSPDMSIGDLASHGLVSTPEGTALRTVVDDLLEAAGRPTEVAVETAHLASVVPMVLAGAGATVLPRAMATDAATGVRVLSLDPPARRSVHVVWREGRVSPLAQHFIDFCSAEARPDEGIDGLSSAHSRSV